MSPVESSGASPDREAVAAVLAQCDADFARDLGAAPAELVGLAGKVVKAVHLRMADAVLSLLGATPREDARDRVIVAAIKETESERNRALGVGTTKIDLDECRFERRRATEALLRFMIARKLGATEPAKEPDCELPCFAGGGDHRDVKPGEKCEGCGYVAPAPPVMDEAANAGQMTDAQVMAEAQKGYNWLAASHAEAAREAPEPETPSLDKISADDAKIHELKCWPTPFSAVLRRMKRHEFRPDDRDFKPGDFVTLREWNPDSKQYTGGKLYFRIGTVSRGPFYGIPGGYCVFTLLDHARAAAHGDADAALLAEAHKELSRLHGNLNHTVSLADGCGCRSGRVLAKLDARLGERP